LALLREELLQHIGEDEVARLTLTAGGRRVLELGPVDAARIRRPVRCAPCLWPTDLPVRGHAKHGARAFWAVAARRAGVEEVILHDREGRILEASRSNVIAAFDGALITPPVDGDALDGVTRRAILEAAQEAGLPLKVAPLRVDQPVEELYLCSTLKELAPVVGMASCAQEGFGPLGERLYAALRALIRRETGG
jgi:branched-subunit amino acid aminotransferase/4-amino-4-deoxychorismate lyase